MTTTNAETATGTAISMGESDGELSSADRCVSGLALSVTVLPVPGSSLDGRSDVDGDGAPPFGGFWPPYEGATESVPWPAVALGAASNESGSGEGVMLAANDEVEDEVEVNVSGNSSSGCSGSGAKPSSTLVALADSKAWVLLSVRVTLNVVAERVREVVAGFRVLVLVLVLVDEEEEDVECVGTAGGLIGWMTDEGGFSCLTASGAMLCRRLARAARAIASGRWVGQRGRLKDK
jgi:hypothetical protein